VFSDVQPRNMLEFGIFQGGSASLFSLLFNVDKFVGIDLCDPVERFDPFCNRHTIGERIHSYYGVSQTDKSRIDQIVRDELGIAPFNVVI
jgi:hypothetical protein